MPPQKHHTTTEENSQELEARMIGQRKWSPAYQLTWKSRPRSSKPLSVSGDQLCNRFVAGTAGICVHSTFLSAFEYVERFHRLGRCVSQCLAQTLA